MKARAILGSVLSACLVASGAAAQSGFVTSASTAKTSAKMTRIAGAKLVSSVNADGKQILVFPSTTSVGKLGAPLSGSSFSTALAKEKASASGPSLSTSGVAVTTGATAAFAPGQTLVIGSTGTRIAASRTDTLVVSAPATAATALSANPLAATVERQVFAGDLTRDTALANRGLTLGSPATAAATGEVAIGPNGFPIPAGTAAPQSGTNPIGPNGFPLLTQSGPQGGIQPIDPNGFPAMNVAPSAQTGLTRAGTPRDSAVPVPAASAGGGIVGTAAAATVPVLASPASGVATSAATSAAAGATSPQ
jgi:hypothetical protein